MYGGGGAGNAAATQNLMDMMGFGKKPRKQDLSKSKDSDVNKDTTQWVLYVKDIILIS